MIISTKFNADTTDYERHIDVLSDALQSMRITGSLLLKESYKTPWAVSVPHADELASLLTAEDAHVAAFHLVERGYIELKLENGDEIVVQAGEMVVCFSGMAHRLFQGSSPEVLPFKSIMAGAENIFRPEESNNGKCTSLICGVFLMRNTHLNPLFKALPTLLHTSVSRSGGFPALTGASELLTQEMNHQQFGGNYVIERLLEILCAEVIRSYIETTPEQIAGWLNGLKDPLIRHAITMIHAQPGKHWSVKTLAQQVAISPSRFAARFSATLGESPMAYVTKWRMYVAGGLLENTQRSIEQIAADVGYESLAAFGRTFKRYMKLPPAAWRARQ